MKFNIKQWQDKHLIKESNLKEIDFKDKAAFDKYQSKHQMRPSTKVNVGGKDTTAGVQMMQHDKDSDEYKAAYKVASREVGDGDKEKKASGKSATASKLTPQQKKSVVSDTVKKLAFNGHIDPSVAKLSRIYVSGMSHEDAKAELEAQINYDPDGTGVSKYLQKQDKKEVNRILDNMYAGKYDDYINDKNIRSGTDDWIRDPELDKRIKKNGETQAAEEKAKDKVYWADYEKRQAAKKAEKLKNRTPKEIEKAKTQFRFSDSDYESPKEYRDNVKDILQKRYDLDKVDPKRMQQMIDGADDYFYHEARSANKAGRRAKTTSAKNFANYIEQYFDEDGIEPKNESVIRRSTRIRESRMYRTIQQLKGLEKN